MLDKAIETQLDKAMSGKVYAWMSERYVADVVTRGLSTSINSVNPDRFVDPVKRLKLRLSKMESFAAYLGMDYSQMILSLRCTKMALK